MTFLKKSYSEDKPAQGNKGYLNSFEEGDNKIRILSDAVMGWEYWTEKDGQKSPVRLEGLEPPEEVPAEAIQDKYGEYMRFFWAFKVWNYAIKEIQICTIKQKTIQDGIESIFFDPEWGDPTNYDIKIQRSVTAKGKTEYVVNPSPPSEVTAEIQEAFDAKPIDLQALFTGGDPFKEEEVSTAKVLDEPARIANEEKVDNKDIPF